MPARRGVRVPYRCAFLLALAVLGCPRKEVVITNPSGSRAARKCVFGKRAALLSDARRVTRISSPIRRSEITPSSCPCLAAVRLCI